MFFSQRFFCLPLLLPPSTVLCKIVSMNRADLDACPTTLSTVSLPTLRCLYRAGWFAWFCLKLLCWRCGFSEMPSSFLKHLSGLQFLLDVRCQRLICDDYASFSPWTLMSMVMPPVLLVVSLVFSALISMLNAEHVLPRRSTRQASSSSFPVKP